MYEWGPENGRKVLLVHGISTPCLALGSIANGLAAKGCRVMLLDLWGRGYSDSVDLPHDSRLYATEILLAITSSPLAWTPEGFSLIGYSLGGGIAADFASAFPDIIQSLVLLAPAGLIRPYHFGWQSRLMYTIPLPTLFVEWIVRRRLRAGPVHGSIQKSQTAEAAVNEEIRGARNQSFESAQLSKTRPGVTVASAVQWQLECHEGFVRSFVSSVKHASVQRTPETLSSWGKLGLRNDKVVIFAGLTDPLIVASECTYTTKLTFLSLGDGFCGQRLTDKRRPMSRIPTTAPILLPQMNPANSKTVEVDAKEVIGADKVEYRVFQGGHEFPVTLGEEVVRELCGVWGL